MRFTHFKNTTIAPLCLALSASLAAQDKAQQPPAQVPRLVCYSGSFRPANGQPAQPIESATLSVYRDQTGGDSLWHETQNLTADAEGHYAVVLGSATNEGMPVELFASGEPRWLGVQFNRPGEPEQVRVPMVNVPYALKAADAETLGGKPASAYLLAGSAGVFGATSEAKKGAARTLSALPAANSGTAGYLGRFVNSLDLGNSVLYDTGSRVGAGTTSPADIVHVAFSNTGGTLTGYAVQNTGGTATSYSGILFYDQNGALGQFQGFNNSTHEYRINNVAPGGSINFMLAGASKFLVRPDGDIEIPGSVRKGGELSMHGLSNSAALGDLALNGQTTGYANAALGGQALRSNTTGTANTATGHESLELNTAGSQNVAVGLYASQNSQGSANVVVGAFSAQNKVTGDGNLYLGYNVANDVTNTESNTTRLGGGQNRAFVAGVRGVTTGVANAVAVMIDSNGQLGTVSSSRQFKEDIQDMGDRTDALMKLRPVTFRYKQPTTDGRKPLEYGLIAEEVEEVYSDLVVHLPNGDVETVQYHKVNAMLLNEVQKQHRGIQALKAKLAGMSALESRLAALETAATGVR